MTTRTTAFGVGLMLAGLAGWAAIGGDEPNSAILQAGPITNRHTFELNRGCRECTAQGCVPTACITPCEHAECRASEVAQVPTDALERAQLCVNGHPRHRAPGITYGHKPVMRGHQRDHYVSLGLGGPDVAGNVHYQILVPFAEDKDEEERQLERAACAGKISFPDARQQLAEDWPLDLAHGYDHE